MATETRTSASPALQQLIGGIRTAIREESDNRRIAERVAELLQPHLEHPDFLTEEQLEPNPNHYRQHILHVELDGSFSIVALVWLPGQMTPIHDHVSWCVVGVHQGEEHETVYDVHDDGECLIVRSQSTNPVGSLAALTPPGDIHHVANAGDTKAVSLHIYGADIGKLGSSIRRRYGLDVRAAS